MKTLINKHIFMSIIFSMFITSSVSADFKLVIAPYRQLGYNTCWAAVSAMILNAYKYPQSDEKAVRCWVYPIPSQDCDLRRVNDQFNSGADINFKAGGSINLEDGITINNGSSVDFIVDPVYW
jgi:hypothetical protein